MDRRKIKTEIMKTSVKTTIKGFENIYVKENVQYIYEAFTDKHPCILLTSIGHDGKETPIGIKKTSIKLYK